ncbi:hypothetical protein M707_02615 [Arthrobacter sp. AK-YN10]|nr:hypothetical protein M707_02615 [Arthrobacter sp. AK-YN10]
MSELFDGDGYPTEAALLNLETFYGSPSELFDYTQQLMRNGSARVEDSLDTWGRPRKKITLITMGWSGCESVIGSLHKTLFHFAFWESSFRGGLFTYEVPAGMWESAANWGDPSRSNA